MVRSEEIAALPLFAGLDPGQQEQLSRVAADVTLARGERARATRNRFRPPPRPER